MTEILKRVVEAVAISALGALCTEMLLRAVERGEEPHCNCWRCRNTCKVKNES